MARISVIIPVFNAEKFLKQCLDSVIQQTLEDVEIICVDDGSTDSSLHILEEYARIDQRITIIRQKNLSAGAARNNGLKVATGEYIHFLDADDWLKTDAYEKLYIKAAAQEIDVCVFQFIKFDNKKGNLEPTLFLLEKPDQITSFMEESHFFLYNTVVVWNKIYRRKFLIDNEIKFDEIICANDRSFYIHILLKASSIIICDDYLLFYRINNSESLNGEKRYLNFDCHFIAYDTIQKLCADLDDDRKSMVIDITMADFFNFYHKAGNRYKELMYSKLHVYFQTMDIRPCKMHLRDYKWYKDYKKIKRYPLIFFRTEQTIQKWLNIARRYGIRELFGVKQRGLSKGKRSPKIIVSLTSFPYRIPTLHLCLKTLMAQTMKPDAIILWLAESQFPGKEEDLPDDLLALRKSGLDIEWCDDLRPHKKYFYTMQKYPDDIVITVDDDLYYDLNLIKTLYKSYKRFPNAISAMRTHHMRFLPDGNFAPYIEWNHETNFFLHNPSMEAIAVGVGGVLYPPHCLDEKVFNKKIIEQCCLNADDLWLKFMGIVKGTKVVLASPHKKLHYVENTQEVSLYHDNHKGRNDEVLRDILAFYNKDYGNGVPFINLIFPDGFNTETQGNPGFGHWKTGSNVNVEDVYRQFTQADKFVLYGAGNYATQLLTVFERYHLAKPFEIWDIDAKNKKSLHGIPVIFPPFERMGSDYRDVLIIIAIMSNATAGTIRRQLQGAYPQAQILYGHDVFSAIVSNMMKD